MDYEYFAFNLLIAMSILLTLPVAISSGPPLSSIGTQHGFNLGPKFAQPTDEPGPSLVSVSGRQLVVRKRNSNGTVAPPAAYTMRGVVWSPSRRSTNTSPGDPKNVSIRRLEFAPNAAADIPLLRQMNVNTVYLDLDPELDATGTAILDLLYSNGIMAVITVDNGTNDTGEVGKSVSFFKNHPAVLAWALGDELNVNLYNGHATSPLDAAQRTQTAANLIKTIDLNHPVVASYGEIDINSPGLRLSDTQNYVNNICPSVDLWGLNIYRGNSFGTLFEQWQRMTGKPMFIGEFGTDAFRSFNTMANPAGNVDEALQAQWTLSLWSHLFANLSGQHPSRVAVGGFVFEFNDEFWKVPPPLSQQTGGCGPPDCPNHPDMFANEEYWGMVDIDRHPRAEFAALTGAYDSSYQAPNSRTYRALSRGLTAQEYDTQNGVARFYDNALRFYELTGGAGGGRGFNVAAIDPCTGELSQPVRNFDTYIDRNTGDNMYAMINFLNGLPAGEIILISVADEAGLTDPSCNQFTFPWVVLGKQTLEGLGSQQIGNYCYQNSWAMEVVKGQGLVNPGQEQLGVASEASANLTQDIQATISPARRSFSYNSGNGAVSVQVPGMCHWTVENDDPEFVTLTSAGNGVGSGVVTYSLAANAGNIRAGTLKIAGQTFTVGQAQSNLAGEDTKFDFDGDGRSDISVFRPSSDSWYILNSSSGSFGTQNFGQNGDIPATADFDGDGKADIAIFRPSAGGWYWLNSSNTTLSTATFGTNGDLPVPADYDGDGRADVAVYRPSSGSWYRLNSSNQQFISVQFGTSEDLPTLGDYDGDSRADIAVFRPSTGAWYRLNSSDGQFYGVAFGISGDKPTPADYDGDGKTDVSVYRPSMGNWYRINSGDGSFAGIHFGATGDKPVPADYDGDGKADVAVFRPSDGNWYVLNSLAGFSALHFGVSEDVPIPNAFIH